jgi:SAM-dependent methyltransferase
MLRSSQGDAVREALLELLRCPRCGLDRALRLDATEQSDFEVRAGQLRCFNCGLERDVREGIPDLLYRPPEFVLREAAGLRRFADVMRADGWDREFIRRLPDVDIPYWYGQARAIRHVLATVPFRHGERLLDVGANTCWASNMFARHGLDVVALDIADVELQGLRTADYFLEGAETFFERVLSPMFDPALADSTFDYVFCCQVLHHNDPAGLRRTMRELHRVLRPGGRLLVVNEPLRFPLRLKLDHAADVAEFDGYEHVYFMHQYVLAARAAGFRVTLVDPATVHAAGGERLDLLHSGRASVKARLGKYAAGRWALHSYRAGRFWWKHAIRGDASLSLTGFKAE